MTSYELSSSEKKDLAMLGKEMGVSELLKPLTREISLFDTYIAGTAQLEDSTPLFTLNPGDKLSLRR